MEGPPGGIQKAPPQAQGASEDPGAEGPAATVSCWLSQTGSKISLRATRAPQLGCLGEVSACRAAHEPGNGKDLQCCLSLCQVDGWWGESKGLLGTKEGVMMEQKCLAHWQVWGSCSPP